MDHKNLKNDRKIFYVMESPFEIQYTQQIKWL